MEVERENDRQREMEIRKQRGSENDREITTKTYDTERPTVMYRRWIEEQMIEGKTEMNDLRNI